LAPLKRILADIRPDVRLSIVVVQHRHAKTEVPVASFGVDTKLAVRTAQDMQRLEAGTVYFAPAGRHVLVTPDSLRVVHGPRENLARPSIDVLFRSAAVTFGSQVVGVILSGELQDGAAGLRAIRRCGGYTVVQDPADAGSPALPRAALEMSPNRVLPAAQIGALLNELAAETVQPSPPVPRDLEVEARAASAAMTDPSEIIRLGEKTHFSCPECQGPLWLLREPPEHFRCDVGHSFGIEELEAGQAQALERALWVAYRVLAERAHLLQHMAQSARERGMESVANSYIERMQELSGHARDIIKTLEAIEPRPPTAEPLEKTS
jgi:two-component system chemotaxis response regulator CheB